MLGFPTPYPDELLYSTIARAGVHDGDTSPKQLLDQVFNNRKVVATVDLPSHVQVLSNQYPESLCLNTKTLIERHTLWPIYAPFHPRERTEKLIMWMSGASQGAVHLASGMAASRVKVKARFYVCVECLNEQKSKYGEYFWNRLWQVPLVKVCPKHGPLHATSVEINGEHRHSYIPLESVTLTNQSEVSTEDFVFGIQASHLLNAESAGISFSQWTSFYRHFAVTYGFLNKKRIDYGRIHHAVIRYWGPRWLEEAGVLPPDKETSWLRAIFRKHRKSFSFVEHIVAITALSGGSVSITDAINSASRMQPHADDTAKKQIINNDVEQRVCGVDEMQWKTLLKNGSPNQARKRNPALYARLYRNHHDWLMLINQNFSSVKTQGNHCVDWPKRDRIVSINLLRICERLSDDLNAPHLSRTFLIHQLQNHATIEKNLSRLPRCTQLLNIYTESTSEYQARRLSRAYLAMKKNGEEIKRWSLLRKAGLSDQRMTEAVSWLLAEILGEQGRSKV